MWRLQGGRYIPGFSGQAFGAGLQRDVTKTRKDQAKKAAALEKYYNKRSTRGKWLGNIVGTGVGLGLGAMGMGPLGLTIGKTLGAGLGSRLGSSEMLSGKGPSMKSGVDTGLLSSTYEQLGEAKGGIGEAMKGQAMGAAGAQLMSGMTGMAGDKLGAQVGDMFGKWNAGRTGLSGFEGEGLGNVLGLDASGAERFTPGMSLFEDPASMTGYGGFGMNPQGFQSGGALGKAFGLSKPSLKTGSRLSDAGKFISEYDPSKMAGQLQGIDELGTKKFFDFLGSGAEDTTRVKAEDEFARMKFLEAAQGRAGERVQKAEEDLLGGMKGAKDTSSAMQNYLEGQKFFRQQDPSTMESMMNPSTGEPLGDLTTEDVPFEYYQDLKRGQTKNPYEEAMSMFPEAYQDRPEPESRSWIQRILGRQQGGMMPGGVSNALPYNIGGSVQQQPMAYQLGGLLKYRRSPMMG
jgi:hypothetical protein